ncbi:hypothetical protein TYRP_001962 [Tyrophagus putrescentiae]|nr:hypothetical protein TYRP_001962 [Tyrophagus putrescentiae]
MSSETATTVHQRSAQSSVICSDKSAADQSTVNINKDQKTVTFRCNVITSCSSTAELLTGNSACWHPTMNFKSSSGKIPVLLLSLVTQLR